jgi:hypothetical protein
MTTKQQYYPHMKFIKLDLLTLLISLFLFASCENTSTIGLEIDPSSAIVGDLIDTVTIGSRTLTDDVANTLASERYPLGFLKDPVFGTTEANLSMAVNLPYSNYNFGTSPVIDSAVLVLNYGGQFYGDSTATYSFDVHQLDVNIARETNFMSNKDWTYSTLIGNKTGKIYPTTKYKVLDIVAGKADTLRTVTPQIRIKLDNAFITNNIINVNQANLVTNANFTRFFRGLHVQVNKTGSTGNGGMTFLDFQSGNSVIAIYYKKQNTTTAGIDSLSVNFPIDQNTNPVAATVKHNYTGTPIETQLNNPTIQYPITYLQPMAGLRNKISFPYLKQLKTDLGNIAINKAELVIDLSSGSDIIPYGAAPRLALYRYDIAEKRQNLPDNNTTGDSRGFDETTFGGYYNVVTRKYTFVVTSYIQDLLNGKTQDYGTFIAPTPLTEFEVFSSVGSASRSVIGSFKKTPSIGDNVIKLNIYYTKIN